MQEFFNAVEKMIVAKFKAGAPSEIRSELRQLAKKYNADKIALKAAEKIINLVQDEREKKFFERFAENFYIDNFEEISDKFAKGVMREVVKAIKSGNWDKALLNVKRAKNVAERHVKTVVNTARKCANQAQRFADSTGVDGEYYRYDGPSYRSRAFCLANLGKNYTRQEIEELDNGQGLPVLYSCGGYNCKHKWIKIVDPAVIAEENKKRGITQ